MSGIHNDSPSGAVKMGRWEIATVPAGWWFVPDFGLRHNTQVLPASNITVVDDVLLGGSKIEPYIDAQIEILQGRFAGLSFAGPQSSTLFKADQTMLLIIRHAPSDGRRLLQVQTYVRLEQWLGIITLTTMEEMLMSVRGDYEQFVGSLRIAPAEPRVGGGEVPPA